jgi:hypothetical protein
MTLHIQKFVDRLRGAEARGTKDYVMSLNEAKDLHADITRLLLELENLRIQAEKAKTEEVITVEVGGGRF